MNSKHLLHTHLLDVADKFAYTARDVNEVFPQKVFGIPSKVFPRTDKYAKVIHETLHKDTKLFDILADVTLSENWNKLVFGDAEKLLNILTLRAYMHNMIYLNHNVW